MAKKKKYKARFPGRLKASIQAKHELDKLDVPDCDLDLTQPSSADSVKDSDQSWNECYGDDEVIPEVEAENSSEDDDDKYVCIIDDTPASPVNRKERGAAKAKQSKQDKAAKSGRLSNAKAGKARKGAFYAKGKFPKATKDEDLAATQPDVLPLCTTSEDITRLFEAWNDSFAAKGLAGLAPQSKQQALADHLPAIQRVMSGLATVEPTLLSLQVGNDCRNHVYRSWLAMVEADPTLEMVMVTVVTGDGVTSSNMPVLDVAQEIAMARKVGKAISPDYIGIVEPVMFNSTTALGGGRAIQNHSHTFYIGPDVVAKARAAVKKHMKSLPENFTGAPQIDVKAVSTEPINLERMAAYMFKAPHKAKTWCPPRDGKPGHMHHSEKNDSKILFLRMAMIRSMLPVEKIFFAGGACKKIKTDLRNLLRFNTKSHVRSPDPLLAPSTIGALWVEVAKVVRRKHDWWLPVIIF